MKKNDVIILALIGFFIYLLSKSMESSGNWKYLKSLRPGVRDNFVNFLADIRKLGYTPVVIDSHRSYWQQKFYKQQNSKNATPGHSTHEKDTGIDLVLYKGNKRIDKSSSPLTWSKTGVPELAKKKYKMRWGGDFAGYFDPVHFDYLHI
ncbi:MAG: hypothetical protein ACXVP0_13245 [Bacteroidia bacterium]